MSMDSSPTQPLPPRRSNNGWLLAPVIGAVVLCGLYFLFNTEPGRFNPRWSPFSSPDPADTGSTDGAVIPGVDTGVGEIDASTSGASAGPGQSQAPTATLELPTPMPWDGRGRVTVLLMGLDYADWENTDRLGPPRSDTMILFTVDPATQTAGILSIPRDLWVSMQGIEGENKINTAYRFGEMYDFPGGGPGLAMHTVEDLLGVPVNFYAVVDFYAFEDFIDELGGIQVDVPEEIKVDPIGPGNTVVLKPGIQTLDGPTALAYARNRSTGGDESDRSTRQMQVILAIRERVLSLEMLPLLVLNAPDLYSQLGEGIRTNLSLEQAIRLAWLAQSIPSESIRRGVIGNHEVIFDEAPDGQKIFIPVPKRIKALVDAVFSTGPAASSGGMSNAELILAENSRIRIINQTGDLTLAERTAEFLKGRGLNVVETVQSDEMRTKTRLVDHVDDPYTLRYLINNLHVAPSEIYITLDPEAGVDITIYLGEDWAAADTLQP